MVPGSNPIVQALVRSTFLPLFGLRDEGLLESALARAENYYAYGEVDLFLFAATYAEGIARNHPSFLMC